MVSRERISFSGCFSFWGENINRTGKGTYYKIKMIIYQQENFLITKIRILSLFNRI